MQMFTTGIEITLDVPDLLPVDLKAVLRDRGVDNRILHTEVVSTGTFLSQDSVQLLDKETMRGHQDGGTLQF